MRSTLIALAAISLLTPYNSGASQPTIKVECDGTTVTQVDAVDDRFDKTTQAPFHGIFEIAPGEARLIDGPLMFEKVYPATNNASDAARLQFQAKDGGLTFFRDTGRFELTRLKVAPGFALGQDSMTTETTTGSCRPFTASHVFDQGQ